MSDRSSCQLHALHPAHHPSEPHRIRGELIQLDREVSNGTAESIVGGQVDGDAVGAVSGAVLEDKDAR